MCLRPPTHLKPLDFLGRQTIGLQQCAFRAKVRREPDHHIASRPYLPKSRRFRRGVGGDRDDDIPGHRARSKSRSIDRSRSSDDDIPLSDKEPRRRSSSLKETHEQKALNSKQLVTIGLVSVTTAYMAYSVYQSVEGRKHLDEEVRCGEITPGEARKVRDKLERTRR